MLAASIICLSFTSNAMAKEGGDQYPNGAEGWMAGALPPPGSYFINYAIGYSGRLKNGDGDKAVLGTSTPSVAAFADALRVVHVSERKLWGANWAWHAILPIVYQNVDIDASGGGKRISGIGDLTVDPFVLTWHGTNWHFATGVDINIPVGTYSKDGPGSNGFNSSDARLDIGANYWSFEPLIAVTYLSQDGWEASGKFMLNFKTKNNYTDYQSGDEFHVDYMLGKHLGPWSVGIGGYYLKQINKDTQGGHVITSMNYFGQNGMFSDGKEGQVLAFGPSATYQFDQGMQIQLTWDHETLVENRFAGDKIVFKFVSPFSAF
jgi:hypothetical protein